jgi:hypothetical protein
MHALAATAVVSNANYGRPIPLLSLAYQPRMLQPGFRATF